MATDLPARPRLQVECLEAREVPDGTLIERFDSLTPPSLPTGWGTGGSSAFVTAAGKGLDGSIALVSSGTSRASGLTWSGPAVAADSSVALSVKASTLVPVFVFARGSDLNTATPSYLAAVVTRGLKVELWQVTNGAVTVLGSVASPAAAYFSGPWVRVSLVPTGNSVSVQVTRADTGQFLNANGRWQAAPATAITATTTLTPAGGRVGIGRSALYAGDVSVDNFAVTLPHVSESFDTTAPGATPNGWKTWVGGTGTVGTTAARFLSPANGFASTGGSTTAARAWGETDLPADVDASVAVYLDSLVPARLFVRGSNLNSTSATYYGVSITRGLNVSLVRVVNGVETVIGSLKSDNYFSGQWARVRLIAEGDRLRVLVFRTDTRQWLTPGGTWSDSPDFALEKTDTAITGGGKAGVGRVAAVSGTVTFDDFDAHPVGMSAGPVVSVAPMGGSSPFSGDVTFRATATGHPTRVEFRLNGVVRSVSATSPAQWTLDTTTLTNGTYTLTVRAFDAAGNVGTAEYVFAVNNVGQAPIPKPTIPRHYSHIRIAALAYSGNPMGTFEQNLLRNSVDLVIPSPRYFSTIQGVAPDTPQLIYSNVSNLYQGLLTDWLRYADEHGVPRELAFYHVTKATAFTGTSPSSQPVNWLWGAYQTAVGGAITDVTAAVRGGRAFNVSLGGAGTNTTFGYTEEFRELNVSLASGAGSGWSGVWEYATAVDASGKPTAWKSLTLRGDGTNGLKQSGRITFDPPADWVTASVGGSDRLYYVRFRVTSGTAAAAPEVATVFGRDYVGANGGTVGMIPAFDYDADLNGDGYLTDAEYANRDAGFDARFVYESRLFYPFYGQMRFVTNPSDPNVRRWAADYHVRLLSANPLADGVFLDNATGRVPFPGVSVLEPTGGFSSDSGALVAAISRLIEPKWVMANTAGGRTDANAIAAGSAAAFEEFLLRPLDANWSEVGDAANLIQNRLASGVPYLVIDTYPAGGSPTDSRTQIGALAYYYLVADPERTFLMFFGGSNPASTWTEHWTPAAAVDVGQPTGAMRVLATGSDPLSPQLTYKVFARNYENGLVLYKPLSYASGAGEGTRNTQTATTHQLGGRYRQVRADGTLGPIVTAVSLRNGEGAVLIKA